MISLDKEEGAGEPRTTPGDSRRTCVGTTTGGLGLARGYQGTSAGVRFGSSPHAGTTWEHSPQPLKAKLQRNQGVTETGPKVSHEEETRRVSPSPKMGSSRTQGHSF